MLYFFMSYAHGEDDPYVVQLFRDLCAEVRIQVGEDRHRPVGFQDSDNIRVGSVWPPELVDAVATARTFVPLYSPRYFRSEYCGKEWSLFAWRMAADEHRTGQRASVLIPLLWVSAVIPNHLADIQHGDPSFGAAYAAHGARELVRMRETKHHDAYLEFVTAVAVRIREAAAEHAIPPLTGRHDLRTIPNAFDTPAAGSSPRPNLPSQPPGIPARRSRPILRYGTDNT